MSRGEPLTADEWIGHHDAEGRLQGVEELRNKIFKGASRHIRMSFTPFITFKQLV